MIRVGGHDGVVEWLRRDQVVRALALEIDESLGCVRALELLTGRDGAPRRAFAARCTAKYVARGGRLAPLPASAIATAVLAELRVIAHAEAVLGPLEEDERRLALA